MTLVELPSSRDGSLAQDRAPARDRGSSWLRRVAAAARGSALAVLVALGAPAPGCASPPAESPEISGLPEYTPEQAALFDDVIAPALFGVHVEEEPESKRQKLAECMELADFVAAMKVSTLTRDGAEERGAYRLLLEPVEPALVGENPEAPVEIVIDAESPSYRLLDANRHHWVGSRLLFFARRYKSGGRAVLHFRAEPNTQEIRTAVGLK